MTKSSLKDATSLVSLAGDSSCKPRVTEPQRVEHICLLKLETGDLVSQLDSGFIKVVVPFDVGTEAPIIEEGGLDHKGCKCGGLRAQELDKPVGEDVGIGFNGDNGVGEDRVEEQLLIVPAEGPCGVLASVTIFDKGGLYGLPVNGVDDKVGEVAVVSLESLRTFSESDESGECGGVVACSYVGKLLLERCHLLSPHPMGESLPGCGHVKGGLLLI